MSSPLQSLANSQRVEEEGSMVQREATARKCSPAGVCDFTKVSRICCGASSAADVHDGNLNSVMEHLLKQLQWLLPQLALLTGADRRAAADPVRLHPGASHPKQ